MTELAYGLDAQPGFRVGNAENPDQFLLEEEIGQGGEGSVWLATSPRRNGGKHRWAIKIQHAENLAAAHDESPADALERLYQRAQEARDETSQLQREVAGVVGAAEVFTGPSPHPPGRAGEVRTLYVVSPWVDGLDLTKWLKRNPAFEQVCSVAAKLAAIVDGIACSRMEVVHRDISPSNVMFDPQADTVSLIDFTYAVPTRSGPVTVIVNKGYTAPEASVTGHGSPAADRYSFGGVIFFLLTGSNPPPAAAAIECYDQLVRRSFPSELAAHVTALLAKDPDSRPESLVRWASQLADLGRPASAVLRYIDLDVAVDGLHTTTVSALASMAITHARLGPGALWALVPDAGAPPAPVVVRSMVDGRGTHVDFVIDKAGRLMLARNGAWQDIGSASVGAGLAVARTAAGSALAQVVDPIRDRLTAVEISVDGTIHRHSSGPYLRRVLSALADHDGTIVVVAVSATGELLSIVDDSVKRLGLSNIRSATIGLNTLGEPVCFASVTDRRELMGFERRYGEWLPTCTIPVPGEVIDVACVGQRDGMTLAAAGATGLWVTSWLDGADPDWKHLTGRPCHRVAMTVGAAWRIQLGAIAEGRVLIAAEDFAGRWSTTAISR
ncbi:serine/threonine protein kinase [Nocardia sp. NPDC059246]|uniref:serine/threonine protein kinase n=1 Tax=unclassified Nocardia TaxID=2637762 RepID=UPI0036C2E9C8